MTQYEPSFEPEAEAELRVAARWYERRTRGLGADLVREVDAALERVLEGPGSFPLVEGFSDVRRVVIERFPYALVYMIEGNLVRVLSIAHGRRKPLFWAGRASK